MSSDIKESVYKKVELHFQTNNTEHHTSEISVEQLIVRRGQPFKLTLGLMHPVNFDIHPIVFTATTGKHPSEEQGTISYFGIPDCVERSPSAKSVWKVEVDETSSLIMGILNLTITPPAEAPIGEYNLVVTHMDDKLLLASLVVLFNPWCPDDWVFLPDEDQRQEYVMNDQGIIYKGSGNYIFPIDWDFGQFEEDMVSICMKMLDLNHKHTEDPADDVAARCNPIYVSRVISAMINSEDDCGILQGCWAGPYFGGCSPSHWTGSHTILKQWFRRDCHPVKYGQCWVFAGVMCSVMRLLGIPCRVVTNYESAHDNNKNLHVDVFHADYGVRVKPSRDSVWNYHVWLEGWMKREDLDKDGAYDGWQVLDPTPQEKSDGIYCCGPAPVKAIRIGETHLKYDTPFVFAEVNADCVDWLVKADGSQVNIWSDTKRVGQNISTKSIGSNKRLNITNSYKHREGSEEERSVFKHACTRDYSSGVVVEETEEVSDMEEAVDNEIEGNETDEVTTDEAISELTPEPTPEPSPPLAPLSLHFKEVTQPTLGKDVSLKLVLHSKSSVDMPLSINISVQAMIYNGTPVGQIHREQKEVTLQPEKDLSVPIVIPFMAYHQYMLDCDSMKVSAMVMDKLNQDRTFLAAHDVVLLDPPIHVTVLDPSRLHCESWAELIFINPVNMVLKDCTATLSGSGLWKDDYEFKLPDMRPSTQIIVKFSFYPYKTGKMTLVVNFNCSTLRDIKGRCTVNVEL